MDSIVTQRIPYSRIRVMFDAAKELENQGRDIIHLEIGRPDFNTPPHIVEAAVQALRSGKHHYSQNAGILELRSAISTRYRSDYGVEYNPENEIVVTNGVAQGVFVTISALLNPGDQILIPDPRWVNYDIDAFMNFVEPVSYSLFEEKGFNPDPDQVESLITPRTRMILLASPSNPTGGVARPEILRGLARVAEKHDLFVVSDEIYEKVIYPPAEHVCFASVEGMRDRTVVLSGFSKYYSMTGWRLGYAVGPEHLINPILRYHQYTVTSVNTPAQWGAVEALEGDQAPSIEMVDEFRKRRDYFLDAVGKIPGFSCVRPDGAFYLFPSIKDTGIKGVNLALLLLEKAGVATVAGEFFGKNGSGHLRLSYANSMENLENAVVRIESAMKTL
ncbi:pyridoxal phosphate-dependent aminotransferase [Acidobacteriota bacterium]